MDTKHFSIACQAAQLFDIKAQRFRQDDEDRIMLTYGGPKMIKGSLDYTKAAYWAGYFYPNAGLVSHDTFRLIISIPKE